MPTESEIPKLAKLIEEVGEDIINLGLEHEVIPQHTGLMQMFFELHSIEQLERTSGMV